MQLNVGVLGAVWIACLAAPAQAADTEVEVSKDGSVFTVIAVSRVAAPPDAAWAVLVDYEAYPDFVPNLSLSRITRREPLRVEQRGSFGVLFFRREVHTELEIDERPRAGIHFRALSGDLRRLDTELAIEPAGEGAAIRYLSRIEPDFWVPPLITAPLLKSSIRRKLQAVAVEIERRAALQDRLQ